MCLKLEISKSASRLKLNVYTQDKTNDEMRKKCFDFKILNIGSKNSTPNRYSQRNALSCLFHQQITFTIKYGSYYAKF